MDYTKALQQGCDTVLLGIKNFDPAQILDCGQCFRWEADDSSGYTGIAHGRQLQVILDGDRLVLKNVSLEEFEATWKDYFDLNRDYSTILSQYASDPSLAKATAFSPGLRVMRQDPWETLITFILSQNSNIPRIKKMVSGLCNLFGEALVSDTNNSTQASNLLTPNSKTHEIGCHAFPSPEALADLTPEALAPVKSGYRAPYIIDAAKQVAQGNICLTALQSAPTHEIKKTLLQIHGVGPKVADCVLLFGFGRVEVCPMDVWMKRVMSTMYPGGFPEELHSTAGIAQQYLFHYARVCIQR